MSEEEGEELQGRKTTVAVGSMWPSPMDSERDKLMGTLKVHVIPSSEFQLN